MIRMLSNWRWWAALPIMLFVMVPLALLGFVVNVLAIIAKLATDLTDLAQSQFIYRTSWTKQLVRWVLAPHRTPPQESSR